VGNLDQNHPQDLAIGSEEATVLEGGLQKHRCCESALEGESPIFLRLSTEAKGQVQVVLEALHLVSDFIGAFRQGGGFAAAQQEMAHEAGAGQRKPVRGLLTNVARALTSAV